MSSIDSPWTPDNIRKRRHHGVPKLLPPLQLISEMERPSKLACMSPFAEHSTSDRNTNRRNRSAPTETVGTCHATNTDSTILELLSRISSCIRTVSSPQSKFSVLQSMLHVLQAAYGGPADVTDRKLLPGVDKADFACKAAGIFSQTYAMITPSEREYVVTDDGGNCVTELEITIRRIHDTSALYTGKEGTERYDMYVEIFRVLTGTFHDLVRLRVEDLQRRAAAGQKVVPPTPVTDRLMRLIRSSAPSPESPCPWLPLSPK